MVALFTGSPVSAALDLGRDGRWFTYKGTHLFTVGFDCQELASDVNLDYGQMLDLFVAKRINKVRIWVYTWFKSHASGALSPWTRDGSGKHDLDSWDPQYWQRLRDFVSAAQQRDIIVEVSIFAPYPGMSWWWSDTSFQVAWNRQFNVNGAFSSNAGGLFFPEFYDLDYAETSSSGATLASYQRGLVDKTLAELSGFGNVYYEVCNEFMSTGWEQWPTHWAERISGATEALVGANAYALFSGVVYDGLLQFGAVAAVDALNLRFTWGTSPQVISDALHPAQAHGKILSVNESNNTNNAPGVSAADFIDGETQYAWAITLAGGQFGYYWDKSADIGNADWLSIAGRLGVLRDIVETLPFWRLSPVDAAGAEYDGLVTQGPGVGWQVMANPGAEYLIYFWGAPSATAVAMNLPAGEFSYAWYDTRDKALLGSGEISGGGAVSIPAPSLTWHHVTGVVLVVWIPVECVLGADCDDGDPCTLDSCDEATQR